jgi:5-methylcytosine-specific restriction endonuclease McrBC regulatory subunit McrC
LAAGNDYLSLLALWCVSEAELLLKRGLRFEYNDVAEELGEVRGRLDSIRTMLAVHSGRPVAYCDFEELDENSPLNRIVKAACQLIAGNAEIALAIRRRARSVSMRMADVGHLQRQDGTVAVSRLTASYGRVVPLAKLFLKAGGVTSQLGALSGRTFLLRTPEIIEDAVRNILSQRIGSIEVLKLRRPLGSSGLTINPDIVFDGGAAIGDVKYRVLKAEWDRSSLYQIVSFAAGFYSHHCAIFGFANDAAQKLPVEVPVGAVMARAFAWNASTDMPPNVSEDKFVDAVAAWLQPIGQGHR